MQNIQAITVPFQVSEDNGLTWKTVTCVSDHTLPLTANTTDTDTQCGVAVGVGPVKFAPTFTAVANTQLLPGQISMQDINRYTANNTILKYRIMDPQISTSAGGSFGSNLYISGYGLFSGITINLAVGDVVKFSGTFKGIGLPNYVPGT